MVRGKSIAGTMKQLELSVIILTMLLVGQTGVATAVTGEATATELSPHMGASPVAKPAVAPNTEQPDSVDLLRK